ncbi:MAG: outer membrane lipoprotein-sorting protein [Verrucomicrobiota bacterium]
MHTAALAAVDQEQLASYRAAIEAADTPEAKGLAIAVASDFRDTGWADWQADADMVLKNQYGESSTRKMTLRALEQVEEGDKRLINFDHPRDVKGTAFLVFTHKVGNDDRWLYLPALKRVKRISSSNQSGPFVGSEFSYEDLNSQEVEKYEYKYLRDEVYEGKDCYVLERYPVDEDSGYQRQINWIDKAEFRVLKTDYYDRRGDLLKTLTQTGWVEYQPGYWRADTFAMKNHQNGKSTDLVWSDHTFSQGMSDRDFNKNSLKRVR